MCNPLKKFSIELTEHPLDEVHTMVVEASGELIVEALAEAIICNLPSRRVHDYRTERKVDTSWFHHVKEIPCVN